MTAPQSHDDYIAATPEHFRPVLARLRSVISQALPEAEEVIMYNMPGFRIGSSIVVSYAGFSKQAGLYCSAEALAEYAEELAAAGLKPTKTGVTFPPSRPIPDALVTQLAQASRKSLQP